MTTSIQRQPTSFTNQIRHGDCIKMMRQTPAESVDFVLTDPPYLVNYRDRSNRAPCRIQGEDGKHEAWQHARLR
jgi:DNA modification methylase